MKPVADDLATLRDALLDLPSSGRTGFEGLLATVFSKLLGVPFRLAKSGSQFGVDGKSADPEFPVAFEAKRYKDNVPSTEVLNKIGALAIRDDPTELWVLGTTGIVATQAADDLEALATRHGFSALILDWQADTPALPPADRLIAVLGDEGNGKSWLAMKSWAELPSPPLTVVFSQEELGAVPQGSNWDLVLAQKLLAQTEDSCSDVTTKRWLRRLDRWRRAAAPPSATVLMEGRICLAQLT